MKRLKRWKWILIVVVPVIVALAVYVGWQLMSENGAANGANGLDSQTTTVERGDIAQSLIVYGEVVPAQEYTFTFQGDVVSEIYVKEGNRVEEGEILVELEKTQAQLDLLTATRALSEAEANGIPAIIDEKKLSYEIALQKYEDTTLRAPFAGVVAEINQATTSSEGWSLVLIDTSDLYVEAEVDQLDAPNLSIGQTADSLIEPLPDRVWSVEIVEIGGMAIKNGNSTVVVVNGRLPEADPAILVGYSVEMEVSTASATDVLRLPISCLIESPRGWSVMRLVDGEATPQPVTIGVTSNDYAEVTDGLQEGDVVLLYPSLVAGDRPERSDEDRPEGAIPGNGSQSGGFPGK